MELGNPQACSRARGNDTIVTKNICFLCCSTSAQGGLRVSTATAVAYANACCKPDTPLTLLPDFAIRSDHQSSLYAQRMCGTATPRRRLHPARRAASSTLDLFRTGSALRGENGPPTTCLLVHQPLHWMKAGTASIATSWQCVACPTQLSHLFCAKVPTDCCAFQGI